MMPDKFSYIATFTSLLEILKLYKYSSKNPQTLVLSGSTCRRDEMITYVSNRVICPVLNETQYLESINIIWIFIRMLLIKAELLSAQITYSVCICHNSNSMDEYHNYCEPT